MKVYTTRDNKVTKYVHSDGSETSIKHSFKSPLGSYGEFSNVTNKFNVFISNSVGCPIKCKFCYLTAKNVPHTVLDIDHIVANVIEAITHQVQKFPELKEQYVKLSWMGMGDPCIIFRKTIDTTRKIVTHIMENNLCKGIDNVDISTTMPETVRPHSLKYQIDVLDDFLDTVPRNPLRKDDPKIRMFYSMHSSFDSTRADLIPYSNFITAALDELNTLPPEKVKVVIHHMFLDEVNDIGPDVDQLINIMNSEKMKNAQLRVLRYNGCEESKYEESYEFDAISARLKNSIDDLKIQISPGSEVKAACGQFLLSEF